MQLRDRGLLSLDDPVARYLPEVRAIHNPFGAMDDVTIRQVMSHSTGMRASTWPWDGGESWQPFEPTRWSQLVAMFPYTELAFAPGSRYSYSNPAILFLGRIIEQLADEPFEAYVHKHIFMPLGMSRSYVSYTPEYLRAHRSHRYIVETGADGKKKAVDYGGEFNPGITIPNGGWNSPIEDVAAYIAFLTYASGGDREKQGRFDAVLRRSSLEEMWQPQLPDGGHGHIGYAFFLLDAVAPRVIGHTGGQGGFSSYFYINPQTGRGIIAAFNTVGGGDAFAVLQKAGVEVLR
jgi:CubicO group peptidase (beta-lactamase class C family)